MIIVASLLLTIVPLIVVYFWATSSFPALARRRRTLAASLGAILVIGATTPWIAVHTHARLATQVQVPVSVFLVTIAIAALPVALVRANFFFASRSSKARGGLASVPALPATTERRQVIEAAAGMALFAASGSAIGWGIAVGRHAFELRELVVRIPGLPRVLDGYVIAQVSDIHAGACVGERELDEGLELVRRARPDLVAATGDLVDIDSAFAPFVARKLADLAPRDGVFACLGNHESYAGAEDVVRALRAAGVRPLVDEGLLVRSQDGGGFALLGVDDLSSKRFGRTGPRLDRALASVPLDRARILLSHQPPTVDDWAGRVSLQLSGHTHGGQINPYAKTVNFLFEYVAGAYKVGETTLYVNRGFGTVGAPARIGVPPEVTRIVLVAA